MLIRFASGLSSEENAAKHIKKDMKEPQPHAIEIFAVNGETCQPIGLFHPLTSKPQVMLLVHLKLVKIKVKCKFADDGRNLADAKPTANALVTAADVLFGLVQNGFFRGCRRVLHLCRTNDSTARRRQFRHRRQWCGLRRFFDLYFAH